MSVPTPTEAAEQFAMRNAATRALDEKFTLLIFSMHKHLDHRAKCDIRQKFPLASGTRGCRYCMLLRYEALDAHAGYKYVLKESFH